MTNIDSLPLAGIRILEFTHAVMGPATGLILADMGAEVIRIEPAPDGDHTRRLKGFGTGYHTFFNRNKKSLVVNVKEKAGLEIVRRLLPSADVLIENFKVGSLARFGLDHASVAAHNPAVVYCSISGFGQAQMVITDINGQQRVMDFALYGTPQLLAAGMSDWSVELGTVRRQYGQESFAYSGDPVFSATGRRGLTDRTTLEGHIQLSGDLQLAGLGGTWRLGRAGGVLTAAGAGSRSPGLDGTLASLGYQWASPRFNLSATRTLRSSGFRDAASLEHGGHMPRRTDQGFVGFNSRLGQLGASYILQADHKGHPRRYGTINWSRQLPGNSMLSLSVNRSLDDDSGYNGYLFWSMPLDRRTRVSATSALRW